MKMMYICPQCKNLYSAEDGSDHKCTECNVPGLLMDSSEYAWDMQSEEKQAKIIQKTLDAGTLSVTEQASDAKQKTEIITDTLHALVGRIEKHLSVIKGILIFYLAITIIGVIIIVATIL